MKAFLFLPIYTGIGLLLAGFEIFVLRPLVDIFGDDYRIRIAVYLILFILVNPFITKMIGEKVRISEDKSDDEQLF